MIDSKRLFNKSLLIIKLIFVFLVFIGNSNPLYARGVYLEVDSRIVSGVHPLFFGVNSLYWIEGDRTRNDPEFIAALREAKVRLIRYPGGEVADNFDWKSNTLDNPRAFPYSKSPSDAKTRMDFDEFVRWKNRIGAQAIIVVNLEEGFVDGDLKKAARLAAEWVRYANIEKKYGIKYWEIGNESYHLGTRYALKSREYAEALKIFSKAMKAVDPSIKIGANGPWDYRAAPIIDVLSDAEIRELHSLRTSKARKRFRKRFGKTFVRSRSVPSWWNVIAKEAADAFDFAVVHRYTPLRKRDKDLAKPLKCKQYVQRLRRFLSEKTGKYYPIAVTEYNVSGKSGKKLSKTALSLTLAEMMGNYLSAGVEMANYWPMRLRSKRAMFDEKTGAKRPPYYVFKAFSTLTDGYVLKTEGSSKRFYALATADKDERTVTLFMINKRKRPDTAEISLPAAYHPVQSWEIDRDDLTLHSLKSYPKLPDAKAWKIGLDPLSLTIVRFRR